MCAFTGRHKTLIAANITPPSRSYREDPPVPENVLQRSLNMSFQVYTLAISGDDQCMAVGMGNLLAIFRRDVSGKHEQTLREAKAVGAGLEYSMKYVLYFFSDSCSRFEVVGFSFLAYRLL